MKLADLPQVQRLSIEDKLQLVDELWQEVARELDTREVTSEEKSLLDKRWATFSRNPEAALTVDQLREEIQKRRG